MNQNGKELLWFFDFPFKDGFNMNRLFIFIRGNKEIWYDTEKLTWYDRLLDKNKKAYNVDFTGASSLKKKKKLVLQVELRIWMTLML